MIDQKTIDAVFSATRIEDVIGDFVELRRAGANLWGLCPFHNERTPSFSVSAAKGFYKCFGCGESGDAIKFLMKHKQLSYPDAIRYLAKKYHIDIIETELSDEERENRKNREALSLLCEKAQNEYAKNFSFENEQITKISEKTAITEHIFRSFRAGFCNEGDAVTTTLIEEGNNEKLLLASSISTAEKSDYFGGCLTLPICTSSGKIIGFIGINESGEIKTNATNDIFSPATNFFGLNMAASEIQKQNSCIVVDSPLEVLALHCAGIKNCLCPIEKTLTRQNVGLIGRFCKNIILISRNNETILTNTVSIISADLGVKIFSPKTDLLQYISTTNSSDIIEQIQNEKQNFIDFAFSSQQSLLLSQSATIDYILSMIAKIPNDIKRAIYIGSLSEKTNAPQQTLANRVELMRNQK